jgi:hypothetical protein
MEAFLSIGTHQANLRIDTEYHIYKYDILSEIMQERKYMKKTFSLLLCGICIVLLASCGPANDQSLNKLEVNRDASISLGITAYHKTVTDSKSIQQFYEEAEALPKISGSSSCFKSQYTQVLYNIILYQNNVQKHTMKLRVAGCPEISIDSESYSHVVNDTFLQTFKNIINLPVLIPAS